MAEVEGSKNSNGKRDASDGRIPLVILSGFLGAGKTTLLNQLLQQSGGRKVAVLVNDVGEVNIDAALARNVAEVGSESAKGVVELSNGCICCGIQGAFGESLVSLAQRRPDFIVVEASGIAEPQRIVASLAALDEKGTSSLDYVRIVNLVTVVDARAWWERMEQSYRPVRRSLLLYSDPRRPLGELLSLQVEGASLIVLNKTDLVEEPVLRRSKAALEALNPSAEIVLAKEGRVGLDRLFEEARFDLGRAMQGSWHELPADMASGASHDHGDYGLMTFTVRDRYPVSHDALVKYLRSGIPGLLRAKGFAWTDRQPDRVGYFSLAGDSLRFDYLGNWEGEAGDRRQELVFIGVDLDRDAIERSLASFRR